MRNDRIGLSRLVGLRIDLADPSFVTRFVAEPHPTVAVGWISRWRVLVQVLQRSLGRKGDNNGVGRRGPGTEIDRLAGTDLMRGLEVICGRRLGRRCGCGLESVPLGPRSLADLPRLLAD